MCLFLRGRKFKVFCTVKTVKASVATLVKVLAMFHNSHQSCAILLQYLLKAYYTASKRNQCWTERHSLIISFHVPIALVINWCPAGRINPCRNNEFIIW